ncbi:DUF5801 repeats-in-toxin domain-containing protein [Bradyrhizobium sp.]|uniref:DUF5801 repeats-in-toxin domain-containing protein n=1 Tax=Bradyrhizobium sp. TaxID=376 RepID=UPI000AA55020|nr:DUF5801 repeats-in-toxin domain-containing protein [Bradyrhizobium sp.]
MNGPFQVAQASGTGNPSSAAPPRIFRLSKPQGDQAVVVNLGYDQKVQLDFTAIANEKITLVRVGERLIILFDNKSTVTVEPFFDSRHDALKNLTVEVAPGREVSPGEFASLFPITDDQSVLPAAGNGPGNAQGSGANFSNSSVDPLNTGNPLDLLGQEQLPNFRLTAEQFAGTPSVAPSAAFTLASILLIHDETLDVQILFGANDQASAALPAVFSPVGLIGWAESAVAVVAESTANFGTNGPGTVAYSLTTASGAAFNGVASGLVATVTGNQIFLFTEGSLVVGREGISGVANPGGAIAFELYLDPVTLKLSVAQYQAIQHNLPSNPDTSEGADLASVVFVQQIVTDSLGGVATAVSSTSLGVSFLDDGPTITRGEGEGEQGFIGDIELDETIGEGESEDPEGPSSLVPLAADRYNGSETESFGGPTNGTADDTGVTAITVSTAPTQAQAIGQLSTSANPGALLGLFPPAIVNFGTDGPGPNGGISNAFTLVLSGATVATTLTATALAGSPLENLGAAARQIELVQVNDTTIEGRIVGDGIPGNGDEFVAFRITLVDANTPTAHITIDQFLAIDHGGSENPSQFDEQAFLNLIGNGTLDLKLVTTVTDGDGDFASSPVQINLIGNERSFISFDDDGPILVKAEGIVAHVDEDGLPGHNDDAGRTGETAGSVVSATATGAAGSLHAFVDFGTDGPGATAFHLAAPAAPESSGLTSKGGTVLIVSDGNVLHGYVETGVAGSGFSGTDREVFTLIVGGDGSYTFTLKDQIDHDPVLGGGDDTENLLTSSLDLSSFIVATDGDGDSIALGAGSFTVQVRDDIPILTSATISRTVDEDDIHTPWSHGTSPNDGSADGSLTEGSTGAAIVTGTLAGLVSVGADEPGTFGFTTTAVAQLTALGLFSKQTAQGDGDNGKPLFYQTSSGGPNEVVITGYEPNPQGNPVFSLTLNTVTGAYEFRLFDELIHFTEDGQNTDLRSGLPVNGVQATVPYLNLGSIITFTDRDGDSVTLSGKFTVTVTDDVPEADIDLKGSSVTVDESAGNQADDTTSSSVKALFASLENSGIVGDDPDVAGDSNGGTSGNGAIAYARSDFAVVINDSDIGADSPPYPHQFTLSVAGGDGTASGLFVTDGSPIILSSANGLIIGTVSGGTFNGKVAFAIAIESNGEVSVAQYLSLKHDDRGDSNETNDNGNNSNDASPDDPLTIQQTLNGKIIATLTVTDSDGDQSSNSVNIGNLINFLDDGPSVDLRVVHGAHLIHDETPGIDAPDDDVAGTTAFAGLTLATVFAAVDTPSGDDPDVTDNPIGYALATSPVFSFATQSYGADGAATANPIRYELLLSSSNVHSGLVTTEGRDIHLFKEGNLIVGRYEPADNNLPDGSSDEVAAFAISIDPATGQLAMVQYVSLRHPDDDNPDDTVHLDNHTLSVRVTITDGDGDPASDTVDISEVIQFEDDGPAITNYQLNPSFALVHDESSGLQDQDTSASLPGMFSGLAISHNDDPHVASHPIGHAVSAVSAFTSLSVNYGADGQGPAVRYSLDLIPSNGANSGIFVNDVNGTPRQVFLFQKGDIIVGTFDGSGVGPDSDSTVESTDAVAFAIGIDPATGAVHLVQYLSVNHSNSNPDLDPDEIQFLASGLIRAVVTVEDGDGDTDSESVDIGARVGFSDDGPVALLTATSGTIVLDETDNDADDGSVGGILAQRTVNGSSLFTVTTQNYGADGPKDANNNGAADSDAKTFSLVLQDAASGLVDAVSDLPITLSFNGTSIEGKISSGEVAFTIAIDSSSGNVTVTQLRAIEHNDPADHDESASPAFMSAGHIKLRMTLTDDDGDQAVSDIELGAQIKFEDDGPKPVSTTATVTGAVEEDGMTLSSDANEGANGSPDTQDGNKQQPGDDSTQDQAFGLSGSLSPLVSFGSDGPAANGGFSITTTQLNLLPTLYAGGQPVVYSSNGTVLTATNSVGQVVFTLTVNANGSWNFDLDGQLDHVDDNTENFDLRTNAFGTTSTPSIDFSSIIVATDGDGDSITGLAPGRFQISVQDDIPTIVPPVGAGLGPNLIVNGSFEDITPNVPLADGNFGLYSSINGWQAGDSTPFELQRGNIGGLSPFDGTIKVELDGDTADNPGNGNGVPTASTHATIQQTIATAAGQAYQLTFYYSPREDDGPGDSSGMQVLWNGTVVHTLDGATEGWQQIVLTLTGTGSDTLAFRGFGAGEQNELGAYLDQVSLQSLGATIVDEDGLPLGNHDFAAGDDQGQITDDAPLSLPANEATASGVLGIVWGSDAVDSGPADSNGRTLGGFVQDTPDAAGDRSVTFAGAVAPVGLTSHGAQVTYWVSTDGTFLIAYRGAGVVAPAEPIVADRVFEVSLSDDGAGAFRFVLLGQLDHAPGQVENNLSLTFGYTATDSDGDSASGAFVINLDDDMPKFGGATNAAVDEDDLAGAGHPGNSDVAAGDNLADPSAVAVSGSFGVTFGADGPAANNAISGVTFTPAVTSDGLPVSMFLDSGIWYGRAGGVGGDNVFSLAFDTGTGQYTFTLLDNLDHPVSGTEDNIVLNFSFTATDFDGDTATGSFSVDVDDDMPVTPPPATNLLVNGDFVGGTFNGRGDFPTAFAWGDNGHGGIDTNGIEGWTVTGSQIERVGNNYLGMTTSNGNPMIDMAASPGNIQIAQTVNGLTAGGDYVIQFEAGTPVPGTGLLEVVWNGVVVATINPPVDSMAPFNLSVVAGAGPNTLAFREIGLSDNTTTGITNEGGTHGHHGTYLANIGLVQVATVDEDGLSLANSFGNSVGIGDSTQIGDAPTNSPAVTRSLGIQWGADDNDDATDVSGLQDTPGGTGDRSLTFTNALVTIGGVASLTSNGAPVSYQLVDNGTRLVGYVNAGAAGYTPGERLVFEVTLSDDGSGAFTVTLRDQLDHAPGANENDIVLSFNYTATDSDGDTATGSFVVSVDDDMPVIVASDACEEVAVSYTGVIAGNVEERGINGADDRDLLLTAIGFIQGNGAPDNDVNTASDIGVGNQHIDGQDTPIPAELLRIDFVNAVQIGPTSHSGHYDVEAASFTIAQIQGNPDNTATVFVQVFDANEDLDFNNDTRLPITLADVTVTNNGVDPFLLTPVYVGAALVGVVVSGLNDGAVVTVNTAADFDRLVVSNYDGVTVNTSPSGDPVTLTGGSPFAIEGISSIVCEPVTLTVAHDESAGFTPQSGPNAENDVDPATAPLALTGAIAVAGVTFAAGFPGFAVSSGSAAALFVAQPGADEPANISYRLSTSAAGGLFTGQDSGLNTTDGNDDIHLFSDPNDPSIVWGVDSANFATGQKVFALYLDGAGKLWTAQFQPIAHDVDGSSAAAHDDTVSITSGLVHVTGTITDADNDQAFAVSPAGLNIRFQDDGPVATAEASQNVAEGATTPVGQLDFAQGADGATVTHINGNPLTFDAGTGWATVNVALGTLQVKANGEYQFTAANPTTSPVPPVVFNYTVTDADGDTSGSTLTFQITDANAPTAGASAAAVDDDGLTGNNPLSNTNDLNANLGDDAGDTSEATFTGTLNGAVGGDTPGVFSLAGNTSGVVGTENVSYSLLGNVLTATTVGGTRPGTDLFKVEITNPATGAYKVTLLDNVLHAVVADGENATDPTTTLSFTITDNDNSQASGTLTITFDDDAPTAVVDSNSVNEGALLTVLAANGVLNNDGAGADGFAVGGGVVGVRAAGGDTTTAVATGVATSIAGLHGTLILQADGGYTYQSTSNNISSNTTDVFVYTIKDGDGDLSTTTLTINLADANLVAPADNDVLVYENALDTTVTGSDLAAGTVTGSLGTASALETDSSNQLTATGGFGALTYALASSATGTYGTIQINSNGSYTYTLTKPYDTSPDAANGANTEDNRDSFTYSVTDANGNTTTGSITVDIVDDIPTATVGAALTVLETAGVTAGTNLLANDTQGADGATLTHVDLGAGFVAITTGTPSAGGFSFTPAGGQGTYVFFANGDWTFDPSVNASTSNQTGNFTYRITDGDGDTSTATQAVNITNANSPLVISGAITGTVEEEHGLPGGIDDAISGVMPDADADVGVTLTTTTNAVGGSFASLVTGGIDGTLNFAFSLSGNPAVQTVSSGALLSGGKPVLFALDGGNLIGFVNSDGGTGPYSSATDTKVFTVTLTSAGAYTFTLNAPVDHPIHSPSTEDTIAINLNGLVTVTDPGGPSPADTNVALNASITVIDDAPVANAVSKSIVESGVDTNLMLILDVSGSMNDSSGLAGLSRLDLLKAAAIELLEQYDNVGNVKVRVITFNDSAGEHGAVWESVASAKSFILGLTADDGTDYDDATAAAIDAFADSGKLATPGVRNVSYFLSDGDPEPNSEGLNDGEESTWTTFLNNNDIESISVGIGSGISSTAQLDRVAYDGRGAGTNTNGTIVTDLSQLEATLVTSALATSGNLAAGGGNGFGADGGYVKSITADGTTYTYNPTTDTLTPSGGPNNGSFNTATNQLTIALVSGASLVVDLDNGAYTYTPPGLFGSSFTESIGYALIDGDSDLVSSTLSINVASADLPPIVRDDRVITNQAGASGADTIAIPDYALLYNDSDANGQAIAVTAVNNASDGSVTHVGVIVTFTESSNGDDDGGTFTYTGSTTSPAASDTGGVSVDRDQAGQNTLDGTGLGDILIGRSSSADIILGYQGNDVLIGNSGDDTLDGGTGADLMVGGAGNDTYVVDDAGDSAIEVAGEGTDTLEFEVSFDDGSDAQFAHVENLTIAASGLTINLGDQTEGFTVTGSSGSDAVTAGSGNDIIDTLAGGGTVAAGAGDDRVRYYNTAGLTLDGGANGGAGDTLVMTGAVVVAVNLANADQTTGDNTTVNGFENIDASAATSAVNLTGSSGANVLIGGTAGDTFNLFAGADSLTGGGGTDTLALDATSTDLNNATDAQLIGVENVLLSNAATVNLSNQTEGFTITGSGGADSITGAAGNDVIVGAANDALLNGGGGTNTLRVGASFNDVNNAQITSIQNVILTAANTTLVLSDQTEGFTITGSTGIDNITGGSGTDTIIGGLGADQMNGGAGADTFRFGTNDSISTLGGSGDSGTIVGYDVITGFNTAEDKLDLVVAATAATAGNVNGSDSELTISGDTVESHSTLNGMATFFGTDSFTTARSVTSTASLAAVVDYLRESDIGGAGATLAFTTSGAIGTHTFIYQQTTTNDGDAGGYTLVDLSGTTISNLNSLLGTTVDPIVLDLDHNGVSFSSLENGVSFDINSDGAQDRLAWTANGGDGILALDVDGSGRIENGNELFTPTFNGGSFADGIAALASLDGNHDGVIDSRDAAFGDLTVWQDANHNGVSDGGELTRLGDLGISSIELATTPGAPIDGQNIAGIGSFTYADGTTGTFVEVDLDASLGTSAADIAVEFDHGGGDIDLSALQQAVGDVAPPQQPQGGEAPVADAGSTVPAAIAIMHEQAQLAMQLAAS